MLGMCKGKDRCCVHRKLKGETVNVCVILSKEEMHTRVKLDYLLMRMGTPWKRRGPIIIQVKYSLNLAKSFCSSSTVTKHQLSYK